MATKTKQTTSVKSGTAKKKIHEDAIRKRAQKIYEDRIKKGIEGSAESDWVQAEKELKK